MSDRVAVMQAGRIEQIGSPGEIYNRPATVFAASFLGKCNLFEGTVIGPGRVKVSIGELKCETAVFPEGTEILAGIRPERVREILSPAPNAVEASLEDTIYLGAATHYLWRKGEVKIISSALSAGTERIAGARLWLEFPAESLFLLKK